MKTSGSSWDSVTSANWSRRSCSEVRDGSTLCRVAIKACPVPALYSQDSRACSNVSGQELEHSVQVAGVVGVILWRRALTGSSWWRSSKLKRVISLLRPLNLQRIQLICQSLSPDLAHVP